MQETPPLNAFIFDLGKVIVDWNPGYLLHEIAPDDEQLKFLVEEVLDLEWFRAVDAGYPLSKAIEERSKIYPEYADAMQLYVDRWPETIRGFFEGTLEIVRELHASGVPLFVLSNWAGETWARVDGGTREMARKNRHERGRRRIEPITIAFALPLFLRSPSPSLPFSFPPVQSVTRPSCQGSSASFLFVGSSLGRACFECVLLQDRTVWIFKLFSI